MRTAAPERSALLDVYKRQGVSLAEILTGTYFAPLGFGKAMAAILLGHLLGGLMMFAAGMIGAKERKRAMETVKMSFGEKGSLLFAVLNVLQLVGWTAIMIYDGALAADGVLHIGNWVWALVIGILIIVWKMCIRDSRHTDKVQ